MRGEVRLRHLAEEDLALLAHWLSEPHMFPFYMQDPMSLDEVRAKFRPRLGTSSGIECLVALNDGVPFGYVQWYANRRDPTYGAAKLGFTDGISIDYFIGDPGSLGKGLGSAMLDAFAQSVAQRLPAADKAIHVQHADANVLAVACAKRAGFVALMPYVEKGLAGTLYVRRL